MNKYVASPFMRTMSITHSLVSPIYFFMTVLLEYNTTSLGNPFTRISKKHSAFILKGLEVCHWYGVVPQRTEPSTTPPRKIQDLSILLDLVYQPNF